MKEYRVHQVVKHIITRTDSTEVDGSITEICSVDDWGQAIELAQEMAERHGGVYLYPAVQQLSN